MTPDYQSAVLGAQKLIRRCDDVAPEFAGVPRRFERQAEAALAQGHDVTPGDAYFAAAVMYGGAQWPIFANTGLLHA